MKRNILLTAALLVAVLASAAPVSRDQALKAAQEFVSHKPGMAKGRRMLLAHRAKAVTSAPQADEAGYYVFNIGQKEGYVVVSGDDRTPAILGYATGGAFVADSLPDNLRAWLAGYEDQLRYLATHQSAQLYAPADDREAIAPLITTHWDQDKPYNELCPTDPTTKQRCYTGCVATAMAQVMNYYKYPEQTIATIPAYTTYTHQISMTKIAPTAIDWDNMADDYGHDLGNTAEQQAAVAKLMKLCGAACEMDYTSSGSGAQTAKMAETLQTIFGYASSIRYLSRMDYRTEAWEELVYGELLDGRPVLYGGSSIGGGHQFIVDGYDGQGLYHVNWGWSGSYDNYFVLSILNPESTSGAGASSTSDGYSFDQDIVVGVTPHEGEVVWPEQPLTVTIGGFTLTSDPVVTRKSSGRFSFNVLCGKTTNGTGQTASFDLGIGLYDSDGQLAEAAYQWATAELPNGWYYDPWETGTVNMGAGLPEGTYTIKAISRAKGTETWHPCQGSDDYYLVADVQKSQVTLEQMTPVEDLDFAFSYDYEPEARIGGTVFCTVTNNGSFYQKEVFLLENGRNELGGMVLEAEPGQTVTLPFVYTPSSAGEKELSIVWREWGGGGWAYHTLAKTTVTVKPAGTPVIDYQMAFDGAYTDVVPEKQPRVLLTLTNSGTGTFANAIYVQLYEWVASGYYYSSELCQEFNPNVRLAPGATKTVAFELDELRDRTAYELEFVYSNNGSWKWGDTTLKFNTDFSHQPEPVLMGDVDGNGLVNVTDVTHIINHILGKTDEGFRPEAADIDGNGLINVTDVTHVISKILGK